MAKASLGVELDVSHEISLHSQPDSDSNLQESLLVTIHGGTHTAAAAEPAAAGPTTPSEHDCGDDQDSDASSSMFLSKPPSLAKMLGLDQYPEFRAHRGSLARDTAYVVGDTGE